MITRIIAAVQAARTRPPGPLSAVLGAAIASAGIALVTRYQTHLLRQIETASAQLDRMEEAYEAQAAETDRERARAENLRAECVQLEERLQGVPDEAEQPT